MGIVIQLRDIVTRFGDTVIHNGVTLDIDSGETVCLVGGSGSGKTTLLREIAGLLQPTSGEVKLFGEHVNHPDQRVRQALRRRFGMLFQQGALFSALSVFDNVAFPLRELRQLDEEIIHDLVMMKLAMVELRADQAQLMPAELSGGMIKRVALARALSLEPELLLLDEPTAGLDPDLSESFVKLIATLQAQLGFSVVMVTHDLDTLAALATQVAVLADKRIITCASPAEVLDFDHPFIHNFFSSEHARSVMRQKAVQLS